MRAGQPRDYAYVAAALQRYTPAQLISFARRLDQMDDRAFAAIGLSQQESTGLREQLAAWPRDAEAIDHEAHPGGQQEHRPGHEHTSAAGKREPRAHEPDPAGPQNPSYERAAQAGWDDPEAEQ